MSEVQGSCDPKFDQVKKLLHDFVEAKEEIGASITINVDGKNVVDIWGGFADSERTKPWEKDTIVNVWSSTKTVTALAALMLVDRGLLDVDENVSKYWPEFAANGKENVKVRHFLSHTSGVSGWDRPFEMEDLYDIEKSTARLATQAPWWEPGSASGYHALNYGHLIGELVRRVSGKSLKQFVAEEIAGPLGADFQIGAKEKDWPRVATITPPPPFPMPEGPIDMDSPAMKTMTAPQPNANACLTPGWRKAEIGGANGHGNARSVARMLSPVALGGEVDGVKLLSQKTIDKIFTEQSNGVDLVIGEKMRFGIGFGISGDHGSAIVMDLDRRMTISYMMNCMGAGTLGSPRTFAYIKAVYDAVGVAIPAV